MAWLKCRRWRQLDRIKTACQGPPHGAALTTTAAGVPEFCFMRPHCVDIADVTRTGPHHYRLALKVPTDVTRPRSSVVIAFCSSSSWPLNADRTFRRGFFKLHMAYVLTGLASEETPSDKKLEAPAGALALTEFQKSVHLASGHSDVMFEAMPWVSEPFPVTAAHGLTVSGE